MSATPSAITTDNRCFPPDRVWPLDSVLLRKCTGNTRRDPVVHVQSFIIRSVVFTGRLAVRVAVGTANTTVVRRLYERKGVCNVRIAHHSIAPGRRAELQKHARAYTHLLLSLRPLLMLCSETTRRNNKVTDLSHTWLTADIIHASVPVAIPVIKSRSRRDNQVWDANPT